MARNNYSLDAIAGSSKAINNQYWRKTMTTEIEQTRREMYDALKKITSVQLNGQQFFGPEFENALESHLEALRV